MLVRTCFVSILCRLLLLSYALPIYLLYIGVERWGVTKQRGVMS